MCVCVQLRRLVVGPLCSAAGVAPERVSVCACLAGSVVLELEIVGAAGASGSAASVDNEEEAAALLRRLVAAVDDAAGALYSSGGGGAMAKLLRPGCLRSAAVATCVCLAWL